MKTWQKFVVVCVSGGSIWGLSYLISIKPEMAQMIASVNVAIAAACSFLTGYPAGEEQ